MLTEWKESMNASPRVSVGMPVYNGERYLRQAIEGLLRQTFTDFELIICDNASTDRTAEICREYAAADRRIFCFRNDRNLGAAPNYNRAFWQARGQYFFWAAHDDMHDPSFIASCVEVLDARPDVAVCYCRVVEVDETGTPLRQFPPSTLATQADSVERACDVLLHPSPCFEVFGLMRREQVARTELIGSYTGSDRTLILEMAMQGRFHQIDRALFFHRCHPERSVYRYRCARARNQWFNSAHCGELAFPNWRLLAEYARAIRRGPLGLYAQLCCLLRLPPWMGRRWWPLSREIAAAAGQSVRMAARHAASFAWSPALGGLAPQNLQPRPSARHALGPRTIKKG